MTRDPMTVQDQILTLAIFAAAVPAMFWGLSWSDRQARAVDARRAGVPRSARRASSGLARTVHRAHYVVPPGGGDGVRQRPPGQLLDRACRWAASTRRAPRPISVDDLSRAAVEFHLDHRVLVEHATERGWLR